MSHTTSAECSHFQKNHRPLNAALLRLIANIAMLIDHLWATLVPGRLWMNCLGRIAFPIFAFQAAEGFLHTSNLKKYFLRLLLFAFLSEIPFNMMMSGSWFFPFHQNVLFTLLLGLLTITAMEKARNQPQTRNILVAVLALIICPVAGGILAVDYGIIGVLTVIAFYLLRGFPFARVAQLVAMVLLHITFFDGFFLSFSLFGHEVHFPTQGFAVLALIPIWLYNGKPGPRSKVLQLAFYSFYPIHMLILALIVRFR